MMEELEELRRRSADLERELARERQTQFELRRQLLSADEALHRQALQLSELESWRRRLRAIFDHGRQVFRHPDHPDAPTEFMRTLETVLFDNAGDEEPPLRA